MKPFLAYYRVSTLRQGQSGLGLEAQQAAARAFAASQHRPITCEYVEVESGKKNQRPQLTAAIEAARVAGATLLIAKLDRLSRNAAFIFTLRESGVDFVCCDMPDANTLTIGIFAALAQHERETISQRTKVALGALQARGVQLGSPQLRFPDGASAKGVAARQEKAASHNPTRQARRLAELLRGQGHSLRQIATELNEGGYQTSASRRYHPTTVQRLLA